jgi:TolA-binding protein
MYVLTRSENKGNRRSDMRSIIRKLSLLTAALMILAVPALADEGAMDKMLEQGQQVDKNECLLVAINCGNQVDSIQQRIDRIKGEISRGSDVYTNDELRRLNRQLEEANKTLEDMSLGS